MICSGLEDAQLSVFRLRFDWDPNDRAYPILPGVSRKWAIEAMQRTRKYFKKLNPHALASRIMKHERNYPKKLRYIALDLPYHDDTSCWKVIQDENGLHEVRPMSKQEGEVMLEKELPEFKSKLDISDRWRV